MKLSPLIRNAILAPGIVFLALGLALHYTNIFPEMQPSAARIIAPLATYIVTAIFLLTRKRP